MLVMLPVGWAYFSTGIVFSILWCLGLWALFRNWDGPDETEQPLVKIYKSGAVLWSSLASFVFPLMIPSGWLGMLCMLYGLSRMVPKSLRHEGPLMKRFSK